MNIMVSDLRYGEIFTRPNKGSVGYYQRCTDDEGVLYRVVRLHDGQILKLGGTEVVRLCAGSITLYRAERQQL